MDLPINEKLNIDEILKDLENYHPKRKGWTWRKKLPKGTKKYDFEYFDISEDLKNSVGLPAAHYFDDIDPQPESVITSEIASGRFEEDIRRMRMAAWHGADHIMVIRTLGQSHIDSLIEGTPEGIGGIPITRKQLRASRKACDIIEEEVGRPINFHSYVSGIAGPEIAVLFAEEGVNAAHQDPQYNVLYRGVNPIRSFVDAAVAKHIMAQENILQIDGAHNANASAKKAWNVMPELLVQHGINCMYSVKSGMRKDLIALSTVPPTVSPSPEFRMNLVYAMTLREVFKEYKFRAQMNTRYIESDLFDATRIHVLNTVLSKLTSADIQSTITPDEGRNVPWHINSIRGVETAKHTMVSLDGIKEYVKIDEDKVRPEIRELKMRAILMLEEMIEMGGYFEAVEQGIFVDNGHYPARDGDGIKRPQNGGIGAGSVVPRDEDYMAPVCNHFGYNNLPKGYDHVCDLIGGCTLHNPDKIQYIDELDETDNVNVRLEENRDSKDKNLIKPEVEWTNDGWIQIDMTIPDTEDYAEAAALEICKRMNLEDAQVISKTILHPTEGTYVELKAKVPFFVKRDELTLPKKPDLMAEDELFSFFKKHKVKVVAGTVGNDEHNVGLREILDIKHGGIEKFGVNYTYLGTSVPPEKMIDAAIEVGAQAILASMIVTHNDVHIENMKKLHELAIEKGIRDKVMIVVGGTQISNDIAVSNNMNGGFGRGSKGVHVATFIARNLEKIDNL
ncbi:MULTISPECIES: D-ornithine 4,5-aminomutase subunit OraE [Oceanotoga]|jgi:D-ornithine 4,5-aminomutase subunit beta|uniref:D-ornithine 4,5-aminomutase E subunit n=1 Tax=Oceanotoga teriensis TaxID=515440 RepID=A0AA45HIK2_9BACT|nr:MULTISPECIES: D-ornithine 4,5-aminomutase subunit OraE [Oceanotoga]MDN5343772.1 D-ornithine 4,5-aminomutase subunit beta [Oceanotoga sp.]MDO7975995.1 D-ornithine 4,5-aminomutase subunit OraE [Oceanotoga teriensis]PWJ92033.1 D-ornithine 4,5-aminomutase E subunit [Oceanotoga teriensis]